MGNHLAPASRHRQPSPDPAANNGGHSSAASSSGDDVDIDVPALPQDVLFDILLRLPGKQLCRLRAVRRSWRSVLSDPLFVAAHAGRNPDLLVAAADVDLLYDAAASGRRVVGRRPRVLDPDNGAESLLPDHVDHHGEPDTFFVLGWAAAATSMGGKGGGYKVLNITLDFVLGWAAAAASMGGKGGGYKVLNITLDRGRHVQRCKVLTLGVGGVGGGVWRKAPNTPLDVKREPWSAAVANRGVVYIVACGRRIRAEWIAAFDPRTERWRRGLIRVPPSNALSSLLTETGGRLVAASGSFSYASAMHLWRLVGGEDDPEAAVWHKMCTIIGTVDSNGNVHVVGHARHILETLGSRIIHPQHPVFVTGRTDEKQGTVQLHRRPHQEGDPPAVEHPRGHRDVESLMVAAALYPRHVHRAHLVPDGGLRVVFAAHETPQVHGGGVGEGARDRDEAASCLRQAGQCVARRASDEPPPPPLRPA
ncbi:unnamed protein product [Miscanthus lutarioriparius]|uniref:F-box domain-containing protein n=1 Tax=Miscanthus lutarioriparius TaxID=422564 RepID=A0A811SDM4_9POAL|nr:unnamed protein product [Miscanthus lutarioriparius]